MIDTTNDLRPADLLPAMQQMWDLSSQKIRRLHHRWQPESGAPVFTVQGKYTARGWTEWTQGFQFGSALLQFDVTDDEEFLTIGRSQTVSAMASHLTHAGVHDHGFNNVSTYGNLRRLLLEGRIAENSWELHFYELALKVSGAVQAMRWTKTYDGNGFIYSFNGPHSLFCDTIRSLRSLALGHQLGHRLMGENDLAISLLDRLIQHARTTASYAVYYGTGRDTWDVRGRVAHESLFNTNDGRYRAPSTQQGYSPFSTWTRGLSWIVLGYAEQLEFLDSLASGEIERCPTVARDGLSATDVKAIFLEAATAACDYYIESTPPDGIPYWDTGAPGLATQPDHRDVPANPSQGPEPVDSSAAAIACQGLLRLGLRLSSPANPNRSEQELGKRYYQAGLVTLQTLLGRPYLSESPDHEGLLLHSVYHRPNNWDDIPEGSNFPYGESSQWGDYHLREAALTLQRNATNSPAYTFFGPV